MRPIRLKMCAFGPYAGEEIIDFTELAQRNLFLITGPTGAGKTTVFDGICYAFYGKGSGRERDGENLRSDFAAPRLLTEVDFEFSLQGKGYRLRRLPKQLRKKTRGEGFTEQNADAELYYLDQPQRSMLSGVREVNEEVVALLGLNYEQFKQVVMISQGEFRELIMADSKERENILQRLFGTEAFRQVQDYLIERAKGLEQDVGAFLTRQSEIIRSLDGSGWEPLTRLLAKEGALALLEGKELAQESLLADERALAMLQEETSRVMLRVTEQSARIAQGEQVNRKLKEYEFALRQLRDLQEQLPEQTRREEALNAARRAAVLNGAAEACAQWQLHWSQKVLAVDAAKMACGEAQQLLAEKEQALAKERAQDGARLVLQEQIIRLENLQEQSERLREKRLELGGAESACRAAEEKAAQSALAHEQQGKENAALEERRSAAQQAALEREKLSLQLETLKRQCDLKLQHKMAEGGRQEAEDALAEKVKSSEAAQKKLAACEAVRERLEQEWQQDVAGRLAQQLKDEQPCPVCGSLAHPQPALVMLLGGREAELKRAEADLAQVRQEVEQARKRLYETQAQLQYSEQTLAFLLEQLKREGIDALALKDLQEERLEMQQKAQQAAEKAEKLNALERGKAENEVALEKTAIAMLAGQKEWEQEQLQRNALALLVAELSALLPPEGQDANKLTQLLQKERENLRQSQARLEGLREAWQEATLRRQDKESQLAAAEENCLEAKAIKERQSLAFQKALLASGFAGVEAYEAARLDAQALREAEDAVRRFQEEQAALSKQVEQGELEIRDLQSVELTALQEALVTLEARRAELEKEQGGIRARCEHNQRVLARLETQQEELLKRENEYRVVGDLAKVAKGQNEARLSFERYVLAAFFDDIISAANWRLKKMTAGRYEMARCQERGKGNAQSGLDLEVLDQYTGRIRSVKTLSGGESFQASLALALGLADVVQATAGGIWLDTMFIDEGFGTLDPEALDNAIRCLLELQEAGRLVGIISHVPELKESIDARLEVQNGRQGSKSRFVIGMPG